MHRIDRYSDTRDELVTCRCRQDGRPPLLTFDGAGLAFARRRYTQRRMGKPKRRGRAGRASLVASKAVDAMSKFVALTPAAAAGPLLGGAAKLIGLLGPAAEERSARIEAEFERILAAAVGENWSDRGFAAWAKAKAENEAFQELFVATARAYVDRITPVVIPAIALVYREYERAERWPDRFYRGLLTFLCEIEEEEFTALREMLAMLDDGIETPASGSTEFQYRLGWQHDGSWALSAQQVTGAVTRYQPVINRHLRAVYGLLTKNGLALGQDVGMAAEPPVIGLTRDDIARLRRFVAPKS